ncbi:shikimate kinase [uncultured Campylobacter sp.]|uniref:shikimate kinase n=1 Tax=uncultured Campylobacter sp. TaxID=218934 RepID=UPI002605F4FD|nr:shikimate kinase [uncultured Campylobacter sp.]
MSKNLVFIGFMGVGKGTVARHIAKKTGKLFLDTDELIESEQNLKVREIFEKKGEEYFRKCEAKLAKKLAKNVKSSVIAAGGGFAKVKGLKKIGKIIYLKSSFEAILKRIDESGEAQMHYAKRPLLKDLNAAKKLFNERKKMYKRVADLIIDVEGKELGQVAKEIEAQLKSRKRTK